MLQGCPYLLSQPIVAQEQFFDLQFRKASWNRLESIPIQLQGPRQEL